MTKFIPALTGLDPPGALQRSLFALPTRFGGLGIVAPDSLLESEFSASMYVTAPLQSLILAQNFCYSADVRCIQYARKVEIRDSKSLNLSNVSTELLLMLTLTLQKDVTLAKERALPAGSQPFLFRNIDFHCTKQLFEMLLP